MSLDSALRKRVHQLLSTDERGLPATRLIDDAGRLHALVRRLVADRVADAAADEDALELACAALQLPSRVGPAGKTTRSGPRDRATQSAELLVTHLGDSIEPALLERVVRLLHQSAQRVPSDDSAKLLADASNLDDFGVTGLVRQAMLAAQQNLGTAAVLEGADKRELYGYWDARLRDGFHFEAVRALAAKRLETSRQFVEQLRAETCERADEKKA